MKMIPPIKNDLLSRHFWRFYPMILQPEFGNSYVGSNCSNSIWTWGIVRRYIGNQGVKISHLTCEAHNPMHTLYMWSSSFYKGSYIFPVYFFLLFLVLIFFLGLWILDHFIFVLLNSSRLLVFLNWWCCTDGHFVDSHCCDMILCWHTETHITGDNQAKAVVV